MGIELVAGVGSKEPFVEPSGVVSTVPGEALRASEGEDGVEARYVLGGLVAEEELHFGSFVLEVAADVPRLLVALGPPAPPLFVALSE